MDRRYGEFEFFLSREAEEGTPNAQYSRQQMRERNESCHVNECSTCDQKCTVVWANITKAVLDCGFGNIIGQRMCMATSDAGQRTNAMHGAVRKTGYIGVPEKVWAVSAFPEPTHRTAPDLAFFAF